MSEAAERADAIERAWQSCTLTTANPPRTFFAVGFAAGHAARDPEVAALLEESIDRRSAWENERAALREAVAEMQERCAKVVIELSIDRGSGKVPTREVRAILATAIRAMK